MMKYIKIFLASSIVEFERERNEFGTFIRRLNNIYTKRDIYFELIVCEDMSKEIRNKRKQEEYNDQIRESQYFYIIIGQNLGNRSLEEFDVALESFKTSGVPRIWTYFFELPKEDRTPPVLNFMERLDAQLGHDYNTFSHFDTIKLDFLMAIHLDLDLQEKISFVDGTARLDNMEIMDLKNIPVYGKNESLMALKVQKEELDQQFAAAVAKCAGSTNGPLYQELERISKERTRTADSLRKAEEDLCFLCVDISKLQSGDRQLTWREKEAIRLTNLGYYEAALEILRDKERKRELEHTVALVDRYLEGIKDYIQENLLQIKALQAQGLNETRAAEIVECYDEILALALKYCVKEDAIYDYASFLYSQQDYQKGIQIAQKLMGHYALHQSASDMDEFKLCLLLGRLYYQSHAYQEAGPVYHRAEEILCRCPQGHDEEQIELYNNMADLYWTQHHSQAAKDILEKVMPLLESKPDDEKILQARFQAYSRLATLANREWLLDQAEAYHRKAWEIEEFCLSLNPSNENFIHNIGIVSSNLGIVYQRMKRYDDAEKVFRRGFELRNARYKINPFKFARGYSMTCNNYGRMLTFVDGRLDDAEKLAVEIALPIKKTLMERDPRAYSATYADSLFTYAIILSKREGIEKLIQADRVFQEAVALMNEVVEKYDDHYAIALAENCHFYVHFLKKVDRLKEAEYYARKKLEIYLDWDQNRDPGYYPHEISVAAFDLADILSKREETKEEARKMYRISLEYGKKVMEYSARYFREEYVATLHGLLAILPTDADSQAEIEALNRELSLWGQSKED